MTTPVAERLLTAEEYLLTKDDPGTVSELVCGRVVRMPSPGTMHGRIAARITARLAAFVDEGGLGEVIDDAGYLLRTAPDTVRAPDATFLDRRRVSAVPLPETGYYEGAPTLAVEVVSPGETERDVREKVAEYLAAGAERVWEVRPRLKTVTVHRPDAEPVTKRVGEWLTSGDAGFEVDGFELPVVAIFG